MKLEEITQILRKKLQALEAKKMESLNLGDMVELEKATQEFEETERLLNKLESVQ